MNLMFGLLFRGPFWIQLAVAAALVWFATFVQQDETNRQIARAALLEQDPPTTISLADAKPGQPSRVPVELSISAQVALDHNTRLVRKTNFIKTGEDLFYVLLDPEADADINMAQAGIVLSPDDLDPFVEWLTANATGFGAAGPVVTINGLLESSGSASHARDAMKDQGMTIAPDFFFIEPFFRGREASLAAIPNSAAQISWPFFGVAGLFGLIGLLKLRRPRIAKPATAAPLPDPVANAAKRSAEMQASPLLIDTKPLKASKLPMGKSRLLILVGGAGYLVALFSGQSWALAMLPMGALGLMFFALRKGVKSVTSQMNTVLDAVSSKTKANVSPAPAVSPAPLRPSHLAPLAAKTAVKDAGPIRSGFSWKDLLSQPKQKIAPGNDPFERLAQQRLRQDAGSSGRSL